MFSYKNSNSLKLEMLTVRGSEKKTMVLIFGSSTSDKDGILFYYLSKANEFRFIMSPLNHKMESHEPAGHKLLNTNKSMLLKNIF